MQKQPGTGASTLPPSRSPGSLHSQAPLKAVDGSIAIQSEWRPVGRLRMGRRAGDTCPFALVTGEDTCLSRPFLLPPMRPEGANGKAYHLRSLCPHF